jgi:hypothetical protein
MTNRLNESFIQRKKNTKLVTCMNDCSQMKLPVGIALTHPPNDNKEHPVISVSSIQDNKDP